MTVYRKLRILAFWAITLFVYVSALLPDDKAPTLGATDKVDHGTAFLTLSLLARLAYPRLSWWSTAAALIAFGGFIELSQAVPFIHRDASWLDWVADTVAIVVGLAGTFILARLIPRAFAES